MCRFESCVRHIRGSADSGSGDGGVRCQDLSLARFKAMRRQAKQDQLLQHVGALLGLKGHNRLRSAHGERFCAHASAQVHDWRSLISCVQFSERQDLSGGPEALSLVVSTVGHVLLGWGLSPGEILGLTQGGVHRYFVMNFTD